MKNLILAILTAALLSGGMLSGCAESDSAVQATDPSPDREVATDPGWPRLFKANGNEVVVYQPQLDEWVDHKTLRAKAAAVVQLKGDEKEYYGALSMEADTDTNLENRTVLLKNFQITDKIFPNIEDELAKKCSRAVMNALPKGKTMFLSLDRILAGLEGTKEKAKGVAVNLNPPPIYHSEKPAILVLFMGEPKFEAVENVSGLLYAVNTNWDILLEVGSSKYYMLNGESWLMTEDIMKGPWEAATSLPGSLNKLPNNENWQAVKKNIPGKKAAAVPEIFVSTKPAELIVTEGAPEYTPISGTKLMYVTNTESDLFLHHGKGEIYFLTAGRWFKASSLAGPWTAASTKLPIDFQKIPDDHTKAYVLNSIPGTPEAEAAVLLANIPHKATVKRNDTKLTVVYEGDPEFIIIDGTTSVYYAVNTPYSVFRVEGKYYSVHDGVWFVSANAKGPWVVSTIVPDVIYTIPATHPKYNVTYVYIYDSTPDTVVVGYTSGYSGSYVASSGVVMFGVGYWMGSEVWDDHYHHYHYHPHYYSYGSAARYDYYYGGYYSSSRYYGPYGGAGGGAGYNPRTGSYYRGGYAQGPYGSAFAREAYNPYTNRYGAQAGGKTPYGSWGRSVVADGDDWARAGHRSQSGRTVAGFETSQGARAVGGYNQRTGQGAVVGRDKYGDVYAGRDGNVYKKGDNGWQKNNGNRWENVDTSYTRDSAQGRADSARKQAQSRDLTQQQKSAAQTRADSARNKTKPLEWTPQQKSKMDRYSTSSRSGSSRSQQSNLNRDYSARQRGNQRTNTYQQSRSSASRSRSYSGSRGGGGRGGGGRR